MGYNISWYIPGRVVQAVFMDTISLEEAESASAKTAQFIQEGEPPLVHLIADTTNLDRFPTNLNILNRSASKHLWQPKLGWTIVISTNSTTRFITGIITQVARVRFRMFPTLDEGLRFLADQDATLRDQILNTITA
ncbi:MAG: hypothetical protein J0L63_17595 [Anaerolineae bacterium]|nr:hypothetical protein [Anaerolineae bacterium]MBN8620733.1 hypothetical protein [Anaerolineae bacterium]